uniref:CSON003016 protein n=1 Tax=Culicoides sonorensis TaxID=179676 RepID=A0A336MQ26_CULSO
MKKIKWFDILVKYGPILMIIVVNEVLIEPVFASPTFPCNGCLIDCPKKLKLPKIDKNAGKSFFQRTFKKIKSGLCEKSVKITNNLCNDRNRNCFEERRYSDRRREHFDFYRDDDERFYETDHYVNRYPKRTYTSYDDDDDDFYSNNRRRFDDFYEDNTNYFYDPPSRIEYVDIEDHNWHNSRDYDDFFTRNFNVTQSESKSIATSEEFVDDFFDELDYLDSVEIERRRENKRDVASKPYRRAFFDLIIGILDTWHSTVKGDIKRARERRRSGRALVF